MGEPFLTTSTALDAEQSIDHVYYWPREGKEVCRPERAVDSARHDSVAVFEPRCSLEPCPYRGPTSSDGEKPSHVSDNCGWSVDMELRWSHPADTELTRAPDSGENAGATAEPSVNQRLASQVAKVGNESCGEEFRVVHSIAMRIACWLSACFLVPFSAVVAP